MTVGAHCWRRLDADENANLCRIAFFGRLIETKRASLRDQASCCALRGWVVDNIGRSTLRFTHRLQHYVGGPIALHQDFKLRLYKDKERAGTVVRRDPSQPEHVVFVSGLFSKDAEITQFRGLRVETSSGDWGVVDGAFGTDGLLKVKFKAGVPGSVSIGIITVGPCSWLVLRHIRRVNYQYLGCAPAGTFALV